MTREETFVRLLNLGIQVAEIEAALADPKAAIDRYEAAVLFLREYDGGLPTLDAAARPEDRTTAQLVADGDWRPKVGERVIATRNPKQDSLFMLWALDARASCSGTSGVVRESDDIAGPLFYVEHANGDFAWWAADEMRPEE